MENTYFFKNPIFLNFYLTIKKLLKFPIICIFLSVILIQSSLKLYGQSADFSFSTDSACSGTNVSFFNESDDFGDRTYFWEFGDGSTSTEENPEHTYNVGADQDFDVSLTTTFDDGTDIIVDTRTKTLFISTCRADFDFFPDVACSGNNISFINESSEIGNVSYEWDFGDGNTSTEENPQHIYNVGTDQSFDITLTTTFDDGNSITTDSETKTINVMVCNADFSFTPDSACSGSVISFTNESEFSGSMSYEWDFGDGNTSTEENPQHIFDAGVGNGAELFDVTLTVTFDDGSSFVQQTTKTVAVNRLPSASLMDPNNNPEFTRCTGVGVFNLTVLNTSTTDNSHYEIDWGDGSPSYTSDGFMDVTHTYSLGYYEIVFTVTGENGCVNQETYNVLHGENPSLGMSGPQGSGCVPAELPYGISIPEGTIGTTYTFQFDDGTAPYVYEDGNLPPDTLFHTFTEESCINPDNIFKLEGRAENQCGYTQITVEPIHIYTEPIAGISSSISVNDSVCVGEPVTYHNATEPPCGANHAVTRYVWTIDSTEIDVGYSDESRTHTYTEPGLYPVILFAENMQVEQCSDGNNEDTIYTKVIDPPVPTSPDFEGPFQVCQGENGIIIGFDEVLGADEYIWDISPAGAVNIVGGGNSNSLTVNFNDSFIGEVEFNVRGTNMCYEGVDTTFVIEVIPIPYPPDFIQGKTTLCESDTLTFIIDGIDFAEDIIWTVPDGATIISDPNDTIIDVYFELPDFDSGYITVRGENFCGLGDDVSLFVEAFGVPDDAGLISGPDEVCVGEEAEFETGYIDHAGSLEWYVDGNSYSTTTNQANNTISYTFNEPGEVEISVYGVSAECGPGNPSTKTVVVHPVPDATMVIEDHCLGDTISFIDPGLGQDDNIENWYWDFGDGNTSTDSMPNHIYSDYGIYEVTLEVNSSFYQCLDIISETIEVFPLPEAADTIIGEIDVCEGDELTYESNINYADSTMWLINGEDYLKTDGNSITYTFDSIGVTQITVYGINDCGEGDSITKEVTVHPVPEADLVTVDHCEGDTISFIDPGMIQDGSIENWYWDFGDGNTSTDSVPSHVYGNHGIFDVTLEVTSSFEQCADFISAPIEVFPYPEDADTILGEIDVCEGDESTYESNINYADSTMWLINGEDYLKTDDNSITYTFDSIGVTYITVYGINDCGEGMPITKEVNVHPVPEADLVTIDHCVGDTISFIDPGMIQDGSIENWYWNFGDGNTSTDSVPTHVYGSHGVFNVTLEVTSSFEQCADIISAPIEVFPYPEEPDDISGPENLCLGEEGIYETTINFADTKAWLINGNEHQISNDNQMTYTFDTIGVFEITVYGINNCGEGDSITKEVTVHPIPEANMVTADHCIGDTISFIEPGTEQDSTIVNWYWNFGDGNTSTEPDPDHIYSNFGEFEVTLEVTSTFDQCLDNITDTIEVFPYPEDAGPIDGIPVICEGDTLIYQVDEITYADDYIWELPDGAEIVSDPNDNIVEIYFSSGFTSGEITVRGQNDCGLGLESTLLVELLPLPDDADDIIGPDNLCEDEVALYETNFINFADSLRWDVNGENYATTVSDSISYTFNDLGITQITVYGVNKCGVGVSATKDVNVHPVPEAEIVTEDHCFGEIASFIEPGTEQDENIENWYWDFGDGNNSSESNPEHTFNDIGEYIITLEVTSTFDQCRDMVTDTVEVFPLPEDVGQIVGLDDLCEGDDAIYQTDFMNYTDSLMWYIDGDYYTTTTNDNISYLFGSSGIIEISVYGLNKCGPGDPATKNINVHPVPEAEISTQDHCFGETAYFLDPGTNQDDNIESWYWDFGDGNTSNEPDPEHIYDNYGDFLVNLVVLSSYDQCRDSISDIIEVAPFPEDANEIIGLDEVCEQTHAIYETNPIIYSDSLTWYINGEINPPMTNFTTSYFFEEPGTHQITVYGTNKCGYGEPATKEVEVFPAPEAEMNPQDHCFGEIADFTEGIDFDDYIESWFWDFGDGNSSNIENPEHTYDAIGIYQVTLIVSASHSYQECTDSIIRYIEVYPLPEAAEDIIGPDEVCQGDSAEFRTSINHARSLRWVVDGDIHSTTDINETMSYSFDEPGITQITVFGINDCGEGEYITKDVMVHPAPEAEITTQNHCFGEIAPISYETNDNITNWSWDFGDGNQSSMANPSYIYDDVGEFTVSLNITSDEFGCNNITPIEETIIVQNIPVSSFRVQPDTVLIGQPVHIIDESYLFRDNQNDISSWYYDFGDGTHSYEQNPTKVYEEFGTYTIMQRVDIPEFDDNYSCPDSSYREVRVVIDFYVPSAFYPDGKSDVATFGPLLNVGGGYGMFGNADFELTIYNRWGEQVYYEKSPYPAWDGRIKGSSTAPQGVYVWKLVYRDMSGNTLERTGNVMLLR